MTTAAQEAQNGRARALLRTILHHGGGTDRGYRLIDTIEAVGGAETKPSVVGHFHRL